MRKTGGARALGRRKQPLVEREDGGRAFQAALRKAIVKGPRDAHRLAQNRLKFFLVYLDVVR